MQIGRFTDSGRTIFLENNRSDFPTLIIGREAKRTLQKFFLAEPTAYFGNAKDILPYISRPDDVILFELNDERPIGFNPFKDSTNHSETVNDIIAGIAASYHSDIITTRLDRLALNILLAHVMIPDTNLFQVRYFFSSTKQRSYIINNCPDAVIRYELEQFAKKPEKDRDALSESLLNRLQPLIADPLTRSVIGQLRSFTVTDTTILVVDLPETDRAALLASLILCRLKGRVFIERPLLHVGQSIPVVACEYLDQLPNALRDYLLGTGTLISFRLGEKDSKTLTPVFNLRPDEVSRYHLTELPDSTAHVLLDRTYTVTIDPHTYSPRMSNERRIRSRTQNQYGTPQNVVDDHLERFLDGL